MSASGTAWSQVRVWLALLGAAAVIGASIALAMPLALSVVDRAGAPIQCGTGYTVNAEQARQVDAFNAQLQLRGGASYLASDYVGDCEAQVSDRRAVALTVMGAGLVLLLASVLVRPTRRSGVPQRLDDRTEVQPRVFGGELGVDLRGMAAQGSR